jgi:hypothetical protein
MVKLPDPGPVGVTGPKRKAARFQLDYETWRAHLAAPGSRFAPDRAAPSRAGRLDAMCRAVEAAELERRAA